MTQLAPRPEALITVDPGKREINSAIVLVGSSAVEFLAHLHEKTSGERKKIDASTPGEASYHYLPIQLGDIRGFKTTFHLYGFDADERLQPMIEEFLPYARGVIFASSREPVEANVRMTAANVARLQRKLPIALLVPESTRGEWNRPACFEANFSTDQVFPTLKAIAKEILVNLRDGDGPARSAAPTAAPGPTAAPAPAKPWWKLW